MDAKAYLDSFHNWEPRLDQAGVSSFSLDRMERLLKAMRHPESALRFVHIAGSKGKGSAAAYLAYIMRASGYTVGLYTSPHLHQLNERIRILRPGGYNADPFEGCISDADLAALVEKYRLQLDPLKEGEDPVTYYEVLTALAVAHFAAHQVRLVVLETGLGGRLDATNVFETSVCGLTPIGLEHTAILGDTLELIAAEKAAIMKSSAQRAVFADQAPQVMKVLLRRAAECGIAPTIIDRDMPVNVMDAACGGVRFSTSGRRDYSGLQTSLMGRHQAQNAALAIAMAEDLEMYGMAISEESVRAGIKETLWPGRFEIFHRSPIVILDAAHTPASAAACAATFTEVFPGRRAVLLFGVSKDKNIPAICQALSPLAQCVVGARAVNPRSYEFTEENLKGYFSGVPVVSVPDARLAWERAWREAGAGGIVLVSGSIFLVAEIRAVLDGQKA